MKDNSILRYALYILIMLAGCYSIYWNIEDNAKQEKYNKFRCKTKAVALRGRITGAEGRSEYMRVSLNDSTWYSMDIESIKYRKLFTSYPLYKEGDSIFKEANSKEVTIKHGDSISVLVLRCDE